MAPPVCTELVCPKTPEFCHSGELFVPPFCHSGEQSVPPDRPPAAAAANLWRGENAIQNVVLVATADRIPEAAARWPVRVVLASAWTPPSKGSQLQWYMCGTAADVQPLISHLSSTGFAPLQQPLGLILETEEPEFGVKEGYILDVVSSLRDGFTYRTWDAVVGKVCSRHVETVQSMIFSIARRLPNKVAVVFEDRALTYRQLCSMACSFVEHIRSKGIKRELGPVAVQIYSCDYMVVSLLGLYSARYVVHCVDAHPASRAYKLSVCPSQAFLCMSDAVPEPSMQTIFIDTLKLDPNLPVDALHVSGELGDVAFIEYTSGSTGTPKSVATLQERIAHQTRWFQFQIPLTPGDDRVAYNLFFIWYWHITLVRGGTMVIYPFEMNRDVTALMQYFRRHEVHRVNCFTPGLISTILEVEETLPPSLCMVISGGEALPMTTCREWLRKWPHVEFWNNYATTEAAADISYCLITPEVANMDYVFAPIASHLVIWDNICDVVNDELVMKGRNVADGYLPPTPSTAFSKCANGNNWYRTGDRAKWIDGKLFLFGRIDSVVKVRGHRVDLDGVQGLLEGCVAVKGATVVVFKESLWCMVITDDLAAVQSFAQENVTQNHLIIWRVCSTLPMTNSGKRDRKGAEKLLEQAEREALEDSSAEAALLSEEGLGRTVTEVETRVTAAWQDILGHKVGREEPFLQAGGHSLAAMRLAKKLGLTPADIFAFPTIAAMTARLSDTEEIPEALPMAHAGGQHFRELAIVGMAGRFPGAPSVAALWAALNAGTDLLSVVPGAGPGDVPRKGIVRDQGFDCAFWGIPREAAVMMDTTQRTLLEVAYEALEDAGVDPFNVSGRVGVVVCGGSLPHYATDIMGLNMEESRAQRPDEYFALEIGTDKDYLATQISYRLNLQGPSEVVQTACSSSLVAIVRAAQMLRLGLCDYVLCGGASFSPDTAVRKVDGMIWSPDGVCRPFANDANGTVNSDGAGLVVLTTPECAERHRQRVYATVKGVATNNDGSRKAGFSAPSFEGQVEVLRMAHADAQIRGSELDYIEAHGTGTKVGDPLEVQALTKALASKKAVTLGSVKGNIGHMNTTAGVGGFIKAALMLFHQQMVPSLHSDKPNRNLDWEKTPFQLATQGGPWAGKLAAVTSLGIGGTNAHVVLGAPPASTHITPRRNRIDSDAGGQASPTASLLLLSAKKPEALKEMQQSLSAFAAQPGAPDIACIEATLATRTRFPQRSFALRPEELPNAKIVAKRLPVVLLFPGQGTAYPDMGKALEKESLVKRDWSGVAAADVVRCSLAVARALQEKGLQVDAVLGHSVGEWAAAAFTGAIPEKEALELAELRGRLQATMEKGVMLSVRSSAAQVQDLLGAGVEIACYNGAETLVLAGSEAAMAKVQEELAKRNLAFQKLKTERAFHTKAVDAILPEYLAALQKVQFKPSGLPLLSNVTGDWHSASEASSPKYWADHLRQPVRFLDNLRCVAERYPECVIVEVGPTALAGLVKREAPRLEKKDSSTPVFWEVLPTMREADELKVYLRCLGSLWTYTDLLPDVHASLVETASLPTYAFQRDVIIPERKNVPARSKASGPSKKGEAARPSQTSQHGLFYKTSLERIEMSCLFPSKVAVVLDGDKLPSDFPDAVVTNSARAVVAARACSNFLCLVGSSDLAPGLDDTSQEHLVKEVTALIAALVNARATDLEIFVMLKDNLRYAALWGLLRSAAREHPELRMRRILCEDGVPVLFPVMPVELVLKSDGAYAPRLRSASAPRKSLDAPQLVYRRALVTGGLRGLGVKVAEWLVATGRAASLVLVGRRSPQGQAAEALERLKGTAPVEVCLCDVSEWADVQKLPSNCDLVVHCAGNVKDGLLLRATDADVQQVMRPKVRGALHLKEHFPDAQLMAFSSSSGLFGPAGQATYAAANTFLDALMPSVQWGGWGEVGMALDLNIAPSPGERFTSVAEGLECLGNVMDAFSSSSSAPEDRFCVLDVDWHVFRHNPDLFAPDEPMLADIEVPTSSRTPLGDPCTIGDHVLGWELVVGPAGARWRGSGSVWEVCQQHVVESSPVFPATAFIALALEIAKERGISSAALANISFLRPLYLATPRIFTTTLILSESGAGGDIRFTSHPCDDENGLVTLHCTCSLSSASGSNADAIPDIASVGIGVINTDELYSQFAASGFHYGPNFRATNFVRDNERAQCCLAQLPGSPFQLHPATLDAAMHLVSLLHPLGCRGAPQAIRRLVFHTSVQSSPVVARARVIDAGAEVEFQAFDNIGNVMCSVEGLDLAALAVPPALKLYRRVWQDLPAVPRGTWLVKGKDAIDLNLPNVTENCEDSHEAEVFALRAETFDDVRRCREQARCVAAKGICWVIVLESAFDEMAAEAAVEVGAFAICGPVPDVLRVAEGLGGTSFEGVVRAAPGGKALGVGREIVEPAASEISSGDDPFVVVVDPSRGAKGAGCRRSRRHAPRPHEVELKTSLWALNFRDVLVAVGAIPAEVAGHSLGIGGECYGEVVRVGEGVTSLAVGDRVVAVPPDGMGSFTTMDARWVAPAPPTMAPEEAVAGTCVYATAWLALHWLAHIKPGDRVLIHSAAGGVGLAAVHLCLRHGCTVMVTASTQDKRDLLLSLGATAAFDSRKADTFFRGVREATANEGVDVVLNSLSGEAIVLSLKLLRPFGRFVEIGKRDQYEDTRIGLAPFLNALTYVTAHLDVLMLKCPERARTLLEEVWRELPQLPRLPTTTYPVEDLHGALEYFSKGIHIGKVLVSIGATPSLPPRPSAVTSVVSGDVVGGSLRADLGAADLPGGVLCIPSLSDLASDVEAVKGAEIVITASRAVAALVEKVGKADALCVQLSKWESLSGSDLERWLPLRGRFLAVEEESGGNLREWLLEVVTEMAGAVGMEQTFESAGLDSLALISLARRLTCKLGKPVSVVDLFDHPTPLRLLDALAGGPSGLRAPLARARVVCLHGFRANQDMLNLALAPFISAIGSVDWVFLNSPRRATGPTEPNIPSDIETFEWWGQKGGPYQTAWMAPHHDGLEETLAIVSQLAPKGIIGFSQGAALATLVDCAWHILFSAIVPPGLKRRSTPSFHCFDLNEEFVKECIEVSAHFDEEAREIHHHNRGHDVPQDDDIVKSLAAFVSRQLESPEAPIS